ncbi:MAG: CocE/NonD family hydrolase, partial [Gammaproteobacteria bacterium]|nr:CocE/NonD family hydrolase [Gammaproteobacteria bacterium]
VPGPAIGFLQEAVRWWDRWLKGIDNGIEREPALRVWLQEAVKPAPQYAAIPGRWVAEPVWPSPDIQASTLYLTASGCSREPGHAEEHILSSPQTCGLRGGEWCAFGSDGEMPRDQRPDDGFSLTWDTPRLKERIEILGAPVVRLKLSSDEPTANLIVRLCDVAADGSSLRVCYGVLNLTHRNGHAKPEPLVPGEPFTVEIRLNDIAHAFPEGHRIRVAVSTAYWPIVWPSIVVPCLRIVSGASTLTLPVRQPRDADAHLRPFEAPDMAPGPAITRIRHHQFNRQMTIDLTSNRFHYELNGSEFDDASLVHFEDIDLKVGYTLNKSFDIAEDDPLSAKQTMEQRATLARGDWRITVRLSMTQTADAEAFHLRGRLEADEGAERFLERDFEVSVPRRLV